MSKRNYEVEVRGFVTLTIDDEAVSDFDGRKVLDIHENPERWVPGGVTQEQALQFLAIQNGVYGSRDGLADFAFSAISAYMHDFEADSIREIS